jgi:hypothetical protein
MTAASVASGIRSKGAEALEPFERLVRPSLVAIYLPHPHKAMLLNQLGSGFLVAYGCKPILVTARHVLYGHCGGEDPADRAVQIGASTVFVGDKTRNISRPREGERDLCVVHMDEFPLSQCLPLSQVAGVPIQPGIVTFAGFLARDFKRNGGILRPAPRAYTNVGLSDRPDLVVLRHPKRRNVDSRTGAAVVSSKPSGLSGGPMLDTVKLISGKVFVVGVFTEQTDGKASREVAALIRPCLADV